MTATQTYPSYQPEGQQMAGAREQGTQAAETWREWGPQAPPASWNGR